MDFEKLEELNRIFVARDEAKILNSPDFPYSEFNESFNLKLKQLLMEKFGDEIKFDRNETFAYIQAHYKDVGIEINTYNGIILTIEDDTKGYLMDDFKEIFNGIVGTEAMCKYDFYSNIEAVKTTYPTIEWNLHPEARLYDLIMGYCYVPGQAIKNFEDYYTCSIIKNLGHDLFTFDGYKKLFKTGYDCSKFASHKVAQIQKLNPNLDSEVIYAWIGSSRKSLELSEEKIRKSIYMDDGK